MTLRRPDAILVLEDGRTFRGEAYGSVGETFGEAVFTTGMTGYQETLTDLQLQIRRLIILTEGLLTLNRLDMHMGEEEEKGAVAPRQQPPSSSD